MSIQIIQGDALDLPIPDNSVDLVVTSPPYFGLRSYQDGGEHYAGQVGAEATPTEFLASLFAATREMMRVLKPQGSIFVNLGDKFSTYENRPDKQSHHEWHDKAQFNRYTKSAPTAYGVAYKSLMGLPWKYALGAADLGLVIRQEIIWSKNSSVPTRITDRARRTHEQILHFTKGPRYWADLPALRDEFGRDTVPGSVWDIPLSPFKPPAELGLSHYAAFPPALVRPLVRGWCPPGGTVLDPFGGTGTTALVADVLGRDGISVDLSADYCRLAQWRTSDPAERARAAKKTSVSDPTARKEP